ncbi:MAG TPA: DUF2332 family protein [Kofleriaceae bacterium]|nr:DUF2332 family protein [Kofleriaceae bacterium]
MGTTEQLVSDASMWRVAVAGRAPANHRLLAVLAEIAPELGERLEAAWRERAFGAFYERPLLLIAVLRSEALAAGPAHPLWRGLAADEPDLDSITTGALREALAPASVWTALRDRYVQTNETTRAIAWLWPAQLLGCDRGARPLALAEVGCAAGLNLVADALPRPWTGAAGAPLPGVDAPAVIARVGLDRRPLDVLDADAVTWMRACIWAGERERIERFDAAVAAFRAQPARLEVCDAAEAPARLALLSDALPAPGITLAFQTIVRDYFDAATAAAYAAGMRAWLAAAPGRTLWVDLELAPDSSDRTHLAAITAHAADRSGRVHDLELGRTSYHPTDVVVNAAAAARLRALVD